MTNILLVSEDEVFANDLREQITHHLPDFGFIAEEAENALPDIIIVDESRSRLEELHARSLKAPLFFLTSHADELTSSDNFNHLIVKPFSLGSFFDELQSSINFYENSASGYLIFNRYIVRPVKKDIYNQRSGEVVKLTEKEVAVIKYLYRARNRIVSKNELLQEVWGYSPDVTTHTIETHVYRLRQKVEHDNPEAQLILTLDGGYRLKV